MPTPGKNWTKGTWRWSTWAKSWDFTYDYIGTSWGNKVWGEQTWNPLAWYPAGLLQGVKQINNAGTLDDAESTLGGPSTGYTLPTISLIFAVGEILDLAKTLPTIVQTHSLTNLEAVEEATSIDANTLDVISLLFTPTGPTIGVELPAVKNIYAAQAFTDIGITLPTIRVKFAARFGDANLHTNIKGRKTEQEKLVRRGRGLFRKSMARAQEDLINEIISDVESDDYAKDN